MSFTDPSTLCLLALAAIFVLVMFRTRERIEAQSQRNDKAGRSGKSPTFDDTKTGAVPSDLAQWQVQMHETARELSAQLDAKLSMLQSLTAEADRAAERLEIALDRTAAALPTSQSDTLHPAGSDDRGGLHDITGARMELDQVAAEPAPAEGTVSAERSRRREEIYQLADYGFALAEIARRVGSPVGEVELILSLRQS